MVMKVFYFGRRYRTRATGEYDTDTGKLTVYKGSIVSESIAQFPRREAIKALRDRYTDINGNLQQDVTFDSPSAAIKFVSGYSANGLTSWHVGKHKPLKAILQEYKK